MDDNNNFTMTSAQSCLHSFFPTIDTTFQLQLSNSPSKLAEAGFERTPESKSDTGISDEVQCKTCGIKYSGWSGERPLAVHRILSPNCFFLNTPPSSNRNSNRSTNTQKENHRNTLRNVRRQLFPNYDTLASKMEDYPDIQHPFVPKRGDFLMLFESFRLLTFQDPTSPEVAVFAKCGFVFDSNSLNAACIFCNQEIEFRPMKLIELEMVHEQKSANCPFVKEYDVGNISCEEERKIKDKVQREMHAKVLHHKKDSSDRDFLIKQPEFESIDSRIGTFKSWPSLQASEFSDAVMADCGFYYTGFKDSVVCFCCGIGLCNWTRGADPWSQHAKASPECFYIQKLKGQEFMNVAQRVQLTVQVEYREEISNESYSSERSYSESELSSATTPTSSLSPSSLTPSSTASLVGSPSLDLDAIKAATYGRYPNKDLLLGTLKAADQSYIQVCQQRQEIIIKDRVIEAKEKKEKELKQKESGYERKLRATQTELARAKDILEWKDVKLRSELEQKHRETLRHKEEIIEQNREIIEQKDELLEQNREIIEQKDVMLELKERELADLHRHVQSLMALVEKDVPQLQSSRAHAIEPESNTTQVEEFPVASCKVCLSNKAQIVFLPCKHLCCCDACAARLYGKSCPICRETNLAMEKVYVI